MRSGPQAHVYSKGACSTCLDSETETEVPSSDSEQVLQEGLCVRAMTLPSEVQQDLCDDMREVRSMRQADAFQPCWLTIRGARCAVVQMASHVLPALAHNSQQLGQVAESGAPASHRTSCGLEGTVAMGRSPRPGLSVQQHTSTGASVTWTMTAAKLHSKDRTIVSPIFDLPMGSQMPFRLVVQAKRKSAGESFARAKGIGCVHLKCEAPTGIVPGSVCLELRMSVGDLPLRGPVSADLARESVVCLPPLQQFWNLRAAVDAPSKTLTVSVSLEWQDTQLHTVC